MSKTLGFVLAGMLVLSPVAAGADELAQIIQQDLVILGYEPGSTAGDMTPATIVAISKFQAENDLEVTGEATPQLAGIIKARIRQNNGTALVPGSVGRPQQADPAALRAAQESCLQTKLAEAEQGKKKRRGLGSLFTGLTRIADQAITGDNRRRVAEASKKIYAANATASDMRAAARDLGLTESDLEECRNP